MPVLALFIGGLLTKVVDFFSTFITKKILITALILTAFYAAITLAYNTLTGYLTSLSVNAPALLQVGLAALPSNTDTCIALCLTTRLSIFIYDTQFRTMQMKLKGI